MEGDDQNKIPGVKDSDLASVTGSLVSAPDLRGGNTERFFNQVLAIAEKRARAGWANEGGADIAVFVLSRYPRLDSKGIESKRVADLTVTAEPLLGKVFFLNGDASQGYAGTLEASDMGEILEWLDSQPFKDSPMVFLYRAESLLVERAGGAGGEKTREETVRSVVPRATVPQLLEGLERFHQREVLTPTVCPPGVWKKGAASKYHPGQDPEKAIQGKLRTFLHGWFKGAAIPDCEDPGVIGRIDIRLLVHPNVPGLGLSYWVVIELKVVKSFRFADETGPATAVAILENAEVVAEGLRQAHAFGTEKHCPPGYLEVFDMRKDKSSDLMNHEVIVNQAEELNPIPVTNVREMFGSASDARKAGHTYAA